MSDFKGVEDVFLPGFNKVLVEWMDEDVKTESGIILSKDKSLGAPIGDLFYAVVAAVGPQGDNCPFPISVGDKVIATAVGKTVQIKGRAFELLDTFRLDGKLL